MSGNSRESMVRSAASLIRTRGVSATSFSEVVADSGAPRGSIYHHFPNGKTELAAVAIRWTSDGVLAYQRACRATSAAGVLKHFIDLWRRVVVASRGASGCAVAGVAIDTGPDQRELLDVAGAAFQSWTDLLASQLELKGVPAHRARAIALTTLASMEGALILCRGAGNSGPLDEIAKELLRFALPNRTRPTARAKA